MGKDAYYFFHDSNARNDPKILAMRSVYGAEGYGWYWMLIEIFRDDSVYKIPMNKYTYPTLAMQLHCDCTTIERYVDDCCTSFVDSHGSLLAKNDEFLWSPAFLKRMGLVDGKRAKNRNAANKRWGNEPDMFDNDASVMPTQSIGMADARIIEENRGEDKRGEKNRGEDKVVHPNGKIEFNKSVFLKKEEYQKLIDTFGESKTRDKIEALSLYKLSKGKKYADDYATILNWDRKDKEKNPPKLTGHAGMKVE